MEGKTRESAVVKYAPGMRIIVRGEEWMVKKVETNSLGNQTLYVVVLMMNAG